MNDSDWSLTRNYLGTKIETETWTKLNWLLKSWHQYRIFQKSYNEDFL